MINMKSYVLDSFSILAYFGEEKGCEIVENLLKKAKRGEAKIFMSYVNLGEVYYIIFREEGVDRANKMIALIKRWPIDFIHVDEKACLIAGRIKATHHISYADAYAIATSLDKNARLVTGDPEFKEVEDVVDVMWIC
jgi:predicted nucleic acid-binding protein